MDFNWASVFRIFYIFFLFLQTSFIISCSFSLIFSLWHFFFLMLLYYTNQLFEKNIFESYWKAILFLLLCFSLVTLEEALSCCIDYVLSENYIQKPNWKLAVQIRTFGIIPIWGVCSIDLPVLKSLLPCLFDSTWFGVGTQ